MSIPAFRRSDHCPTASCDARMMLWIPDGTRATVPCMQQRRRLVEKVVPRQPEGWLNLSMLIGGAVTQIRAALALGWGKASRKRALVDKGAT